ncbi:MAG: adenylate/guanylate cyclase domain-containing protein [Gaiellaceae bacterium]
MGASQLRPLPHACGDARAKRPFLPAARHVESVRHLGARSCRLPRLVRWLEGTQTDDYPWGFDDAEARQWVDEAEQRFSDPAYVRDIVGMVAPSIADDDALLDWYARTWRLSGASPGAVAAFRRMNLEYDIRPILPAIRAPTLVLQRANVRFVPPKVAAYVADRIPSADYVELPGVDFLPWFGDTKSVLEAVEQFLTRARCACAIVDAAGDLGVELRAGLHTGECETIDGKVGGIAVHLGARVAAMAEPGEVLVSGTVKDLVAGSGLSFSDRGIHELKGIPGEWRLYAADQ